MMIRFLHRASVLFLVILFGTLLSACNRNESKVKEMIKESLKDAESAKFKDIKTFHDGKILCGSVNAKNSYGAYQGFSPFIFEITSEGFLQRIESDKTIEDNTKDWVGYELCSDGPTGNIVYRRYLCLEKRKSVADWKGNLKGPELTESVKKWYEDSLERDSRQAELLCSKV